LAGYSPDIGPREKCGVFGAFDVDGAASIAYDGLMALQHRGQEGAGMVSFDGTNFHLEGNGGLVAEIFKPDVLGRLRGRQIVGHTRYGTSGRSGGAHIQPILINGVAFAENGNQTDTTPLERYLDDRGISHENLNDSEKKGRVLGHMVMQGATAAQAMENAYPLFTGAFSSVLMDKDSLVAARDRCGIRPLSLGRTASGGYVVASETAALDAADATFERDIEPGEMVVITKDGLTSKQLAEPDPKFDAAELVYFARPDSVMLGQSVYRFRRNCGQILAEEHPMDADIIIPIPNSGIPGAVGYAAASGIEIELALQKNPYIHRMFISPEGERHRGKAKKHNPVRDAVEGKRVGLLDDSLFRGDTTGGKARMLREAGAKEVHLRILSPPVMYPDFYGIDIPDQEHLIAVHHSLEEIRGILDVDSIGYISLGGMVEAAGVPKSRLCTAIFDGEYPLPIGDREKELIRV
jgi:amidophosphoribosyltransferase